ncbi:DNA-3-methyladenine glycosylase I [Reinekea marina]|uniref:DNA-3-methyladenine glycosylase I n=1 Tax=Reinekea marina TaxID=1310421 RepID=A0ABV7WMU8_9GAMM|nr:DNA-3-methyladenine glycosylase I [Reinekea marina]MDN3648696.1 DNA-3-methyladenine glycosylase I [Reinekea marina]
MKRCAWCGEDEQYQNYHDTVWGRAEYDSQELFKKLCLDGQQAGLSWITILRKQANYEAAFFNFDPVKMAAMTDEDLAEQMHNAGIVRNKLKIESLRRNARAYLAMEAAGQPFNEFIWSFTGGKTIDNALKDMSDYPTESKESQAMSKALKKHGFNFVGPTICYAFMQAVGIINDHLTDCHVYQECKALARA